MNANNINECEWLQRLKNECEITSINKVAKAIGYTASVVSQVLNGKYAGSLRNVETAFRGVYMGQTVICPVLSEIQSNQCIQEQRKGFSTHNPLRVKMWRACQDCPHNTSNHGDEE